MILEPDFNLRGRQTQTLGDRLALRCTQIPRLVKSLLQLNHLGLGEQYSTLALTRVHGPIVAILLHMLCLMLMLWLMHLAIMMLIVVVVL